MKINYSYTCLGAAVLLSVLFGIYAVKCGPCRELDIYTSESIERDKEYYDEEMAVRLATVWGAGKLWGTLEEGVEVVYNYPTNEWLVIFRLDVDDPEWNRMIIGVRRDNGRIEGYY